ncbi:murein biosynthesis integral membrane protein MurJ [Candidatus Gracilibacteria bacterium]|nr:murein biosynthesis integral membrane protein MurJ [Candidatus Gracilibacteria bacterium]
MQLAALLRRAPAGTFLNSLIVMGGFVLSRVTGLLRDIIVSARFGTSADYGAYVAAFRITDLLYMVIIGGALGSAFIPVFIQLWERDGNARAWELASAVVTWALALLVGASVLLFVLAPWLTHWLYGGQGFDAPALQLTSDLTRLFLFSPLLLGLGGLAMAALNARDRFTLPALAPTIYNLGIIFGALFLTSLFNVGIWGLGWGVVLGALGYLLIQLPGLRALQMRLQLKWGRGLPELALVARQMGPRVFGQAASQISLLITAALTARLVLGAEKLAALNFAYQVMLLPYGIFALSLSTVAFPRLARLYSDGALDDLAAVVRRTLGSILYLTLPATVALIVLGQLVVRVLFQRGAFDDESLLFTSQALIGYASALPAFAASEILIRTFFAMQRTLIPVLVGLLQVALNLGLGLRFMADGADVGELALAFSIANNLEAIVLFVLLGGLLPGIWRSGAFWYSLLVALCATLLLGMALFGLRVASLDLLPALGLAAEYQWQRDLLPLLIWLGAVGFGGALLYLGITWLLGAQEPRTLLARLRRQSGSASRGAAQDGPLGRSMLRPYDRLRFLAEQALVERAEAVTKLVIAEAGDDFFAPMFAEAAT